MNNQINDTLLLPTKELCSMNYLAHAYLSFSQPEILVGNMISDFVKGKQKFTYSAGIQNGITLHRQIDTFTDAHEATRMAKRYFKPAVGLYSGAFMDIVYDHFLALDANLHTPEQLAIFAENTYNTLDSFNTILPDKFVRMLPYMRTQNWLVNYGTLKGIENSFAGLARRSVYLDNSIAAFDAFTKNYDELKQYYGVFFPQVKLYVKAQLHLLNAES